MKCILLLSSYGLANSGRYGQVNFGAFRQVLGQIYTAVFKLVIDDSNGIS